MMTTLNESVAVITGATSGIGKATAKAFHSRQIRMILHGRNEAKLKQIAKETECNYVLGDITDPDISELLLQAAKEHFRKRLEEYVSKLEKSTK